MFSTCPTMRQSVIREATCVFAWSITSLAVESSLSSLASLSTAATRPPTHRDDTLGAVMAIASVLAGWAMSLLPPKVASRSAPGFSFGSTWVLLPLRDRCGVVPNLPCRIAEAIMGRLTLRELVPLLPVHFLVPALAFWSLRGIAPSSLENASAAAVWCGTYSEEGPWLVDLLRETFANALFVVGLLVVPELLRINGVRRGFALLILYPIYSFGVDADGKVRS